MGMPSPIKALSCIPSALRVRVQIGGVELASIGDDPASPWSGVATVRNTERERTDMGRTESDGITVRIPLSLVSGGAPPDNARIGIMFPGESAFTTWRLASSRRVQTFLFTMILEPLHG
jgi:hypothetical protein